MRREFFSLFASLIGGVILMVGAWILTLAGFASFSLFRFFKTKGGEK